MQDETGVTDVPPCLPFDTVWTSLPARLFVFDLDDTLTPSKSPLPPAVAHALARLLVLAPVCIISGGQFEQFRTQVLGRLDLSSHSLRRLHLMPTCGTRYYRWDGEWHLVYAEDLDPADRAEIERVLRAGAEELGLVEDHTWGPALEDRGTQVTFSALGQEAPVEAKAVWDPDGAKKSRLRAYAAERLPAFEVRSGGSTSIDVTRRGIDKAYGIERLVQATGIGLADLLFVGDRLDADGNDFPVRRLGVRCVEVSDWEQTVVLIERVASLPLEARGD